MNIVNQADSRKPVVIKDYVIVQVDTDALTGDSVPEQYRIYFKHSDGGDFTVKETIEIVRNKLIELMQSDFYAQFQEKIIFAISVNCIECWLLPLYQNFLKKKVSKTENCLNVLNQALQKTEKFFIDKKDPKYYRVIAERYCKNKELLACYHLNPSLKIFIESLPTPNEMPD